MKKEREIPGVDDHLISAPAITADFYVFGADPVDVHFFVSVHYLLNQLMDFDHTCIYIFGRRGRVD